jgi:uncharacterized protein DUF6152
LAAPWARAANAGAGMNMTSFPRVKRGVGVLAFAAIAAAAPAPAFSHHSAAMFDASKTVEHKGTVKKFLWVNPHSLLVVSVRNSQGEIEDYSYEANGPGYLVRNGWKRESVKPGDEITVVSNPLIDGRPGGNLVEVTLPDGSKLSARPQPPSAVVLPSAGEGRP